MSKRNIRILLEDILESINKIFHYTDKMSFDDFVKDDKTIDAVVRNFEIIGEASNRIPENVRNRYPSIEWHRIISIRNRIIHEYFGVDYQIIWEIINTQLGILKNSIITALDDSKSEEQLF